MHVSIERFWNLCFFRLLQGTKIILINTVDVFVWKIIKLFLSEKKYKTRRQYFTKEIESNQGFLVPYIYGQMILFTMLILFAFTLFLYKIINVSPSSIIFKIGLVSMIIVAVLINYYFLMRNEKYLLYIKEFNELNKETIVNVFAVIAMFCIPIIIFIFSAVMNLEY